PPGDDLERKVALGGGPPHGELQLARHVAHKVVPERGEVAHAVRDRGQAGGVVHAQRPAQVVAAADAVAAAVAITRAAHLPPFTTTRREPASGRLGSLSQRTISSLPTVTVSGIGSK